MSRVSRGTVVRRPGRGGAALSLALVATMVGPGPVWAAELTPAKRAERALGRAQYATHCIGCHGPEGDGQGAAAAMLLVKPRDFTRGIFKFRSTPNGTLPTDADLMRTLVLGVSGTAMPGFPLVGERERLGLIETIKDFYPEWQTQGAGVPIVIPPVPSWLGSPAAVARGRSLYLDLDCGRCHGDGGRGDGPSARTLEPDVWGNPQKPFNFTKGSLRGGDSPEAVYRTFMTGINGTAMPSYADVFDNPDGEYIHRDDAWNLVSYILSLRRKSGPIRVASNRVGEPNEEARP